MTDDASRVAVRFRLREVLEERGISQSEASRRSGVAFATVNRMCTNATAQVSLDVLDRLCEALACGPGDLLDRDAPRKRKAR